ncbi:myocyte-specific enhancer factor 2A-like isoform X1 [Haliotis rubra]|uniref:myocyte-specific enhancer factor 2A-like isoform X1 n=1 Tax=Haliotis rubra TaxID=36100 RepID=UPI001EE5B4B5|nr:myocyte-specific enhancer factor 2A-like isoform X1 [Haliotis rubra]XP_046562661.1 myocyte-specific enhancer factor 2A-like isoform X1 [Haliotis rubra]XP_046562662.1 myocyte-specific enhancer factor 2A-like isoform X1 [Haliotis rubra]XP_046562663.1 myocyte-specific enhancer factor 2A-like isoform X1 [Haliotis rubra]XP_046562664.1 myocyte-specific enhancer factor 2A-like isoform X1 [Haliotis rubra]XP_046562665.1 myocyte-specific enhancer factor 2A-like isoform X1 [Haliotis rubra]XP_04656266
MGRKKIQISRIGDERNRQVTFTKRKFGLMKKAYELSVLCDCEIALIIFNGSNKLFQYASTDMDKVLLKYTEYNEPHESRTNKDIIEALNKKEHKGCESPEPIEQDPFAQGLRGDDKYERINDDYQRVMQQNVMRKFMNYPQFFDQSGGIQQYHNTMPVPIHNSGYPSQPGLIPPPQNHVLSGSPGLLQPPQVAPPSHSPRPNSTGGMVDLSHSPTPNGYPHRVSPCSSPGVMVHHAKQMAKQSPTPTQMRPNPNLRVMIPPHSRGDLMSPDLQGRVGNSLVTPVVSLATPNMPGSGYPSSLPSSFHPNDFPLTTADVSNGYNSWCGQGSLTTGSPHHSTGLSLTSGTVPHTANSGHHLSPLAINTMTQPMNIKSEPISPPRDSTTPSSHHQQQQQQLRPPSAGTGHLSPGHISHSNSSSPVNVHTNDYDGPMVKRSRIEGWAT